MNDGSGSDGGNGHTAFFSTTGPIYPALVEKTCVLPQFQRPSGGKRGEGGLFFEPEPLTMEGSHSLPFQTRLSLLTGILRRLADDFFGELSKALGKGEGDGGLRLHACPPPHTHTSHTTLSHAHTHCIQSQLTGAGVAVATAIAYNHRFALDHPDAGWMVRNHSNGSHGQNNGDPRWPGRNSGRHSRCQNISCLNYPGHIETVANLHPRGYQAVHPGCGAV